MAWAACPPTRANSAAATPLWLLATLLQSRPACKDKLLQHACSWRAHLRASSWSSRDKRGILGDGAVNQSPSLMLPSLSPLHEAIGVLAGRPRIQADCSWPAGPTSRQIMVLRTASRIPGFVGRITLVAIHHRPITCWAQEMLSVKVLEGSWRTR
jgi:hypothetical protein